MSRTCFSSSITRTLPVPRQLADCRGATAAAADFVEQGRTRRNVLPRPGSLRTSRAPRCTRAMPCTAASPRPRPVNFVVKKGSKTFSITSAVIPHPVSATSRKTDGPAGRSAAGWEGRGAWGSAGVSPVRTVTVPPPAATASEAFVTRFRTTWRSCVASASTGGRRRGQVVHEFGIDRDHRSQQPGHVADEGGQVDRLEVESALARVRQDLLHEVGGPAGVLPDLLEPGCGGRVLREGVRGQLGEPDDRRQDVVQVVGDPPGQDAQALQLLGPEHLGLQVPPLPLARSMASMSSCCRTDETSSASFIAVACRR